MNFYLGRQFMKYSGKFKVILEFLKPLLDGNNKKKLNSSCFRWMVDRMFEFVLEQKEKGIYLITDKEGDKANEN